MATFVVIEGFEHKYVDSGSLLSSSYINSIGNAAQVTYDTGRLGSGSSLKVAQDGIAATFWRINLGSIAAYNFTVFFKVIAGSTQCLLMRGQGPANPAQFLIGTDGSMSVKYATGTAQTSGATNFNDGNWHQLDAKLDVSGTTWTIDWKVDGVTYTQATIAGTASAFTGHAFGSGTAADTATLWFDDFVMSTTAADYPLGPHKITGYGPTGDSATQNPGARIFTVGGAQSSFYAEVDDMPAAGTGGPADTSSYIYQNATDGTTYAQVDIADTSETNIAGVMGTVWYFAAGTSSNDGKTSVYSAHNGSLLGHIYSGDMSDTTVGTRSAVIPPATSWDQTSFNAITVRMGLSADGSPNPYWTAVFLQIATPMSGATTLTRTHTTDATLLKTATRTHTTDAIIKTTSTLTHTTDAIVKKTFSLTHTTNAVVVNSILKTHTTNAIVKKTLSLTHTTNAIVKKTSTKTHTTNAWIGTPTSPTLAHTTDAWIVGTPITHTTDALILSHLTQTHTTNAIIKRLMARQHSTDAYLTAGGGLLGQTRVHFTNALVKKSFTKTHTTNAIILKPTTKTHTTNAYLLSRLTKDHTTDAILRKSGMKQTHTTNAYIVSAAGGIGNWTADIYGAIGALGSPLVSNPSFKGANITWVLDGPGSASIDLKEDIFRVGSEAAYWRFGERRVRLSRNGTPLFTGYLTGSNADHQSSPTHDQTLSVSLLGCGDILNWRVVHGDFSSVSAVATSIAWDLVQHANAQESTGITLGDVVGTAPARTRYFCDGDVIGEAIKELAEKDTGGFDYEVDEDLQLNMWVGGRGTDRSATYTLTMDKPFKFTEVGNATDVTTYVTAMGEDPDGPCGPPLSVQNQALSNFPRREVTITGEGQSTSELIDTALDELKARQKARYRVTATFDVNALPWGFGPTGLWLGDLIFVTQSAAYGGATVKMRLIQVDLSLEQGQNEFMTYTFEMAS